MKQEKLVPELRFNEFHESWIKTKLGNLANDVSYGIGSAAVKFDGENKYLRITDIDEGSNQFSPNPVTSPKGPIDSKYYLKDGDIVFARTGASVGKTYKYKQSDGVLVYAGFLIKFSINKESDSDFIFLNFRRQFYWKWVSIYSMRSGQPGLNAEEYKAFKINLPSLPEQQKIADFLTSVDHKIQALTRKVDLLKEYHKGVMQKIFSQEIRFSDENGEEFPDWGSVFISKVCTIKTGNKDTQNKVENGSYPFYVRSNTIERINTYSRDTEAVLTTGDGVGVGNNFHYVNGKFDYHQRVYAMFDFTEGTNGKYFFYFFSSHFGKRVYGMSAKNSVDSVRMDMIAKMPFLKPSLEEQTKIASFLTSIDYKIGAEEKKLDKMKEWKKGLLQKMFV